MTPRGFPSLKRVVGVLALACPLLLADCRDPTQITVHVTTDAQCPDLRGTTITVGPPGALENRPEAAYTASCSGSGRIGTLVLVPSGDKDADVAIRVVTGVGKMTPQACVAAGYVGGCIVARRSLRYLPHTPLDLPIAMTLDCIDVPCGETETCFNGSCVPAKVDPNQCAEGNCEPSGDGGKPDAAPDVASDQSSGGAAGSGGAGGVSGSGGIAGGGGVAGSGGTPPDASSDGPLACTAPTADCNLNPSDGCEVNLQTSTKNCGSCGHDCLGGSCNAGVCQPVTLWGTVSQMPTRLAVDATNVYFVDYNAGNLRSIPKSGGTATLLATGAAAVRIALDASFVYWTDSSKKQVLRVAKTGGTPQVLATLGTAPTGLALTATDVYVTDTSATGALYRVPIGGGTPTALESAITWPLDLALTSSYVYWTTFANNGALYRAPIAGGTPEVLDPGLDNSYAITLDATNVYYTVAGTGTGKGVVYSLPLGGGTHLALATAQKVPKGIVVDGKYVYWTNSNGGTVMRIAADGTDNGVPTTVFSGGIEPLGIAVDTQAIYWADDKTGLVMKLAK